MLGLQLRRRWRMPPRYPHAVPSRGHSVKAGNAICSSKRRVRASARRPGETAGARRSPSDRFSFSSRRGSMLAARPAAVAEARVHRRRHKHGDRRRQRRHRHRTFAVPPTRSRAHARTRRYTAVTVADPSAVQTRSHRVVFVFCTAACVAIENVKFQ